MREDLLVLELPHAQAILAREGIVPAVTRTSTPRRAPREGGVLRVVYASDDGMSLTAADFVDPVAACGQDNSR